MTIEQDGKRNFFILHRIWYGQIRQGNQKCEFFESEEKAKDKMNKIIKIRKKEVIK